MKTFLNRPKRFGWRKPEPKSRKTERAGTPWGRANPEAARKSESPSKRRTGMRVWAENRSELEPLREQRVKGKGYLLAPCLVLWAAAWGTREAYQFAMANMAVARGSDFKRV